jgi:hypothetical protein
MLAAHERVSAMRLNANNPDEVKEGKMVKLGIKGPRDANQLLIFTGTAVTNFKGPVSSNERAVRTGGLSITLLDAGQSPREFIQSATFASVAAESSGAGDPGPNDEWLFDVTEVKTVKDFDGSLTLEATLSTGVDSILLRVAYQANVLIHE